MVFLVGRVEQTKDAQTWEGIGNVFESSCVVDGELRAAENHENKLSGWFTMEQNYQLRAKVPGREDAVPIPRLWVHVDKVTLLPDGSQEMKSSVKGSWLKSCAGGEELCVPRSPDW